MSGLEVVGLVAAVVSAFAGGKELFSAWRKHRQKKRATKQKHDDKAVETSMVKGRTKVQKQYDEDFRRLRTRFAKGHDQARLDLYHHMMTMQSAIINLLGRAMGDSSRIVVNVDSLFADSEEARKGSIAALTSQFQRMMQTVPIVNTSLFDASGAESNLDEQTNLERCPGSLSTERLSNGHVKIACSLVRCCFRWLFSNRSSKVAPWLRVNVKGDKSEVLISWLSVFRQHGSRRKGIEKGMEVNIDAWSCYICVFWRDDIRDLEVFEDHLRTHSRLELRNAFELITEQHGTAPSSSLSLNWVGSAYCCWMTGCQLSISVEDVRDTELETWDGRMEIFRHKCLGYNWRLLAPYLLSCHVQVSKSDSVTFECPICSFKGAEQSDKRTALQLFLGHIRVHDPKEILRLWNDHVHDHCTCSLPARHDRYDRTAIGAIETDSKNKQS